jgi:hypothetical protein
VTRGDNLGNNKEQYRMLGREKMTGRGQTKEMRTSICDTCFKEADVGDDRRMRNKASSIND